MAIAKLFALHANAVRADIRNMLSKSCVTYHLLNMSSFLLISFSAQLRFYSYSYRKGIIILTKQFPIRPGVIR